MRAWPPSWSERAGTPGRLRHAAVVVAVLLVGTGVEYVANGLVRPRVWLPDLAVGAVFLLSGWFVRRRSVSVAALLALVGITWFAGALIPGLVFLHRGPVIHLLVTYPKGRPVGAREVAFVVSGYASSASVALGTSEAWTLVLAGLLAGLAWWRGTHRPEAGPGTTAAAQAAAVLATVLFGAVVARQLGDPRDVADLLVLLYDAALIVVAALLAWRLPSGRAAAGDRVVELATSGTLREALATTVRDPSLQVGFVVGDRYEDEAGEPLSLNGDGGRVVTPIDRDGAPFAVLVHDPAALADPDLRAAVASATRLTGANAELTRELRRTLADLARSRRRLVTVADEERRHLRRRLDEGPEERLRKAGRLLDEVVGLSPPAAVGTHVTAARHQIRETLRDLDDIATGLHPRELSDGLASAVGALCARAPVDLRLSVSAQAAAAAPPLEVSTAAWFACAEALANAVKHARATVVDVGLTVDGGRVRLSVADDGIGGADPARGTGLQGVADRVAAVGGTLSVTERPGGGTRLVAELPLGDRTQEG